MGALAVDPLTGFLYYAYRNGVELNFNEAKHNVFKLDPTTGKVVKTLEVGIPKALATDEQGGVYVFDQRAIGNKSAPGNHITRVLKFNSAGNFVEVVAQNKPSEIEIGSQAEETATRKASASTSPTGTRKTASSAPTGRIPTPRSARRPNSRPRSTPSTPSRPTPTARS